NTAITLIVRYYHYIFELPSFPTRRSSDLWSITTAPVARDEPDWFAHDGEGSLRVMALANDIYYIDILTAENTPEHATCTTIVHRSEEHTSELQSRFDLVCRLLLEKKKKTT